MHKYRFSDPTIRQILKSQRASVRRITIRPKRRRLAFKIPKGKSKEVFIEYANTSSIPLFGLYSRLGRSKPIVLATIGTYDRSSEFADTSWPGEGRNRPSYDLRQKTKEGTYKLADYITPMQDFAFCVILNTNKLAKGKYTENVGVIQENVGLVADSAVRLDITIV